MFTNKVIVQFPLQSAAFFLVTDAAGKIVYRANLIRGTNMITTSGLIAGMYFYKIVSNTSLIQSGKLLKL